MKVEPTPHKYREICNTIIREIETGELVPGSRLPGVRALGVQFGCNYHTVRHAFEQLAEQGLVELRRGSGTYVTNKAAAFQERRLPVEKVLQETDQVGVLMPTGSWGYFVTALLDRLHCEAEKLGLKLNIRTANSVDLQAAQLTHELAEQGCCAVILPWIGAQDSSSLHEFVRDSELPIVLPNPVHGLEDCCFRGPNAELDSSWSDTYLQCQYFRKLGYENIALLGPDTDSAEFFQLKLMQYSRWVCRENLPSLIGLVDSGTEDMDRIIQRWLPMKGELAIIAYHDELALEFMDACRRNGVTVPDDFAILGNNGNPAGLRGDPPLSTMLCPYDYIAAGLISHALALSGGGSGQLAGAQPREFVIRESCGGRLRLGDEIGALVRSLMEEYNTLSD
ncbi:GntR family transcriptional regulator [Verrucomicrobiota bacterium]